MIIHGKAIYILAQDGYKTNCKTRSDKTILFTCSDGRVCQGYMHNNGWFYDYGGKIAAPAVDDFTACEFFVRAVAWADNPVSPLVE